MRTRSSVLQELEAPAPDQIATPPVQLPGSFRFLALPFDVRVRVYEALLVCERDISVNLFNHYYLAELESIFGNAHPGLSLNSSASMNTVPSPKANFVVYLNRDVYEYPATGSVNIVWGTPPPKVADSPSFLNNKVRTNQPPAEFEDPSAFELFLAEPDAPSLVIGPRPTYFNPSRHFTVPVRYAAINARVLQTCKTIYGNYLQGTRYDGYQIRGSVRSKPELEFRLPRHVTRLHL